MMLAAGRSSSVMQEEDALSDTRMVKKLELLESNHVAAERTIPGREFQKDVTQRYTVHI
jgi:hypothetical protein